MNVGKALISVEDLRQL